MSLFSKLKTDNLENAEDRVGGGFKVLPTNIYNSKIKLAYAGTSASGAMNITFICDIDGREYKETIYITNKAGENFYKKNDKKFPIPGFTLMNDICLLVTGNGLSEQDTAEKVVNVYSTDVKKEVPTKVQVLSDLIDEEISLAIQHIVEDKNVKNASGEYVPSGETREINAISKALQTSSKKTVIEITSNNDASFWDKWIEAHKDKVINKAKGAKTASSTAGEEAPTKPTRSLFKK